MSTDMSQLGVTLFHLFNIFLIIYFIFMNFYRSMKGNINLQTYNFNETFVFYKKKDFVLAFFEDPIITSTLKVSLGGSWLPVGK